MPINPTATNRIQSDSVMLYMNFSRLRTRRKLSSDAVQTDIDKDLLHLSKDILESAELQEIHHFDSAVRAWVRTRCLPSPLKQHGIMILPLRLVPDVMEFIATAERDRQPLVEAFLASYERAKEAARPRLGGSYDERDYPPVESVRRAFGFDVQLWELSTPGELKSIDRQLYERELAKMQNIWSEAQATISSVLLEEFRRLTAHLADRLAEDPTGKKKVFRDSAVTKLQQWLDLFATRNLADDAELARHVEQARQLIAGVDARVVRGADEFRRELAEDFGRLTKQLDALLVERPTRAIRLDENGGA